MLNIQNGISQKIYSDIILSRSEFLKKKFKSLFSYILFNSRGGKSHHKA